MYDPLIHHRRSIRLEGYDYSKPGFYFITILSKNRKPQFGYIKNDMFYPSQLGIILQNRWSRIPEFYDNVITHEFIVMPDHLHGILEIRGEVLSSNSADIESIFEQRNWQDNFTETKSTFQSPSKTVGSFIRGFKYGATVDFKNLTGKSIKLFQRDYYEKIIKDYDAYRAITAYIKNNVKNYKKKIGVWANEDSPKRRRK